MHSWAHTQQKMGLAVRRWRVARILAGCMVPQGSAAVCPVFLVAKSNFHSTHMGWETAGIHTSSQNFGFLICETWPNILISAAGRLESRTRRTDAAIRRGTATTEPDCHWRQILGYGARREIKWGLEEALKFLNGILFTPNTYLKVFSSIFCQNTGSQLPYTDSFRGSLLCGSQNEI